MSITTFNRLGVLAATAVVSAVIALPDYNGNNEEKNRTEIADTSNETKNSTREILDGGAILEVRPSKTQPDTDPTATKATEQIASFDPENGRPNYSEQLIADILGANEAQVKIGGPLIPNLDLRRGAPYVTVEANNTTQAELEDPATNQGSVEIALRTPSEGAEKFEAWTTAEYYKAWETDLSPVTRATLQDALINEAWVGIGLGKGRNLEVAAQNFAVVGDRNNALHTLREAMIDGQFNGCEAYLDGIGCYLMDIYPGVAEYLEDARDGVALGGDIERAQGIQDRMVCTPSNHFGQ